MGQNRIFYDNKVLASETILTASSEEPTLPASFLQDQLRQKPWRTKTGWTIVAGFNDKLDFERPPGTPRVATIAAGTYASGIDLATAITAAMETGDPTPTWEVTYGVASANTFRITNVGAPVLFDLMWLTGPNTATSIGQDIGFVTTANDTGTDTYTADATSYQGRHYLKMNRSDGGSMSATVVTLLDPQELAFSPNVYTLQGNATDSWAAPTFSTTFQANQWPHFFSVQTFAWWRLVIKATNEQAGYYQLGQLFLGPYVEPSINVAASLSNSTEDFSIVSSAVDGSHFRDEHRRRDRWDLAWLDMEAADKAILDAFENQISVGENFFFCWNKNDPHSRGKGTSGTSYLFMAAGFNKQYVSDPYWTYSAPFFEAL